MGGRPRRAVRLVHRWLHTEGTDMTDPYVEIAHHLPNDVRVGGALITLVEPHPGFESSYNRWYEDDHFYSGAMAGPWVFSGRRFVATRDLRSQRPSLTSPLADPPDSGCYMSLYWITKGQEEPAERWGFHAMADSLAPRGRGFVERTHIYTAFHRFQGAFLRDQGPLRAETCLAHPFGGLYTEVIDADSVAEFAELTRWLNEGAVVETLAGSDAAACLAFVPVPFSQGLIQGGAASTVADPQEIGRRVCLLWFLDRDPREGFAQNLAAFHDRLAASASGEVRLSAGFIPTVPGTDMYVSELR
jgi:hypothetical protein